MDTNQQIKLSDHFTYGKILRFTLPSVAMMIFTSIYGVVDGFFVSNFVGKIPFAAVNFIMPYLMVLGGLGFMFGTGGSALVSKTLGERNPQKANQIFSLLIYISLALGIVISVVGILILRPVASALGAQGQLLDDCVTYGSVILLALPAYILQLEFQSFFVTAEKPKLGLYMTIASGVTNMVLDAVLVIPFGLVGAAIATGMSQLVGGVFPLLYFSRNNSSLLQLGKAKFDGQSLLRTFTNGSSELLNNISMSLVGMLYNIQLLAYAGENGVAAYGTIMYVNFVFISAFIGYSIGTAPVVGYHFGAGNHEELKSMLKKSVVLIGMTSVIMFGAGILLASPLSKIFVGYDAALLAMTVNGFKIFAVSFLFAGFAIFGSGFFTALNDGLTSAVIAFLRTLVFQAASVLLLPLIYEINGIWWSAVVAEMLAVAVSLILLICKRKKYGYL